METQEAESACPCFTGKQPLLKSRIISVFAFVESFLSFFKKDFPPHIFNDLFKRFVVEVGHF